MNSNNALKEIKILSIGNSFSVDTMKHVPNIALTLGVKKVCFGNLFIGGCSINRHYSNIKNNAAEYVYYKNTGDGWTDTPNVSIEEAILSEDWDWISIQHGTGDGSRYTLEESYVNLPKIIEYVKSKAAKKTKIAFNMAWVMESDHKHPEIRSYNGDQLQMYKNLVSLTERVVLPTKDLDKISAAGTAVQNARTTALDGHLLRDGFHLSLGLGRYIAGLTFFKTLSEMDIDGIAWTPEDVTDDMRTIAIRCANNAVKAPFEITEM